MGGIRGGGGGGRGRKERGGRRRGREARKWRRWRRGVRQGREGGGGCGRGDGALSFPFPFHHVSPLTLADGPVRGGSATLKNRSFLASGPTTSTTIAVTDM